MNAAPLRVFVSTGEVSGELLATDLLRAMRAAGHALIVDAIGGERLAAAGAHIVQRTAGWASLGPISALRKIPALYAIMWRMALRLRKSRYDLVILVDFGAFNQRLARSARLLGVRTPILSYFPPGAWLDNPSRARAVATRTDALTAFAHQRDFYRDLGLPIGWVGHPLATTIAPRTPLAPAPADGGVVALLPGSRADEIARHAPRMFDALGLMREARANVQAVVPAANADARAALEHFMRLRSPMPIIIEDDARTALARAHVAIIASGTAVLEAALLEVPTVGMYVLSESQAKIARRVYHGRFITLPNLVLDEPLIPELLQGDASPQALAETALALLDAPDTQRDGFRRMRAALGPPDALDRAAHFALQLARA